MALGAAAAGRPGRHRIVRAGHRPHAGDHRRGCPQPAAVVVFNMARGQQDYFQCTRGGGWGDYRTITLAPKDVAEAADHTQLLFHLADKYRTPVILYGDYLIADTCMSVDIARRRVRAPAGRRTGRWTAAAAAPAGRRSIWSWDMGKVNNPGRHPDGHWQHAGREVRRHRGGRGPPRGATWPTTPTTSSCRSAPPAPSSTTWSTNCGPRACGSARSARSRCGPSPRKRWPTRPSRSQAGAGLRGQRRPDDRRRAPERRRPRDTVRCHRRRQRRLQRHAAGRAPRRSLPSASAILERTRARRLIMTSDPDPHRRLPPDGRRPPGLAPFMPVLQLPPSTTCAPDAVTGRLAADPRGDRASSASSSGPSWSSATAATPAIVPAPTSSACSVLHGRPRPSPLASSGSDPRRWCSPSRVTATWPARACTRSSTRRPGASRSPPSC